MQHATQVALTRRVSISWRSARRSWRTRCSSIPPRPTPARSRRRASRSCSFAGTAVLRPELRAAQARRLPRRRSERRAGAGRAGQATARLNAFLNVCRHRGAKVASGSGSGKRLVRVPLPRLDLRPRGPPDAAAPGVRLPRAQLRRAQPGDDPRRREARPDLGAGDARAPPSTSTRCWAGSGRRWPPTGSTPTATTRRARSPRT